MKNRSSTLRNNCPLIRPVGHLLPRRGGEGTKCCEAAKSRGGFTLIELSVSISIIALLMSLILPAVNRPRESARRIECANKARNIALAMTNFATTQNRFPAAGYWGGGPNPDKNNPIPHHNWVVDLLAYLDRRDLADR